MKYIKKLFWVIVLAPIISFAQEVDSTLVDTVEVLPPLYYLGVYVNGGGAIEPSTPERNVVSFFGVGVQYENWLLEFTRHDFQGSFQSFVIFPNIFELQYRYGGPSLAYRFAKSPNMGVMVSAGYFKGDMTWRDTNDQEVFFRDEFNILKIGVRAEFLRLRYIKPHAMVGYQNMRGLELTGTKAENFSGLFFGVGIRMGYFNQ